jgi:hypothetical protein
MSEDLLLDRIKDRLLMADPVYFVEKYLTIDGEPFRLQKGGWKPFADMYRYIGLKAIERDSKPVVIVAGRQVGKDLALDTPIITTNGWKTMGELQIGDKVFDENREACDIIWASEVFTDHKCYKLTFDDGIEIVAGEDHQWLTALGDNVPSIKTTREIADNQFDHHSIASKQGHRHIVKADSIDAVPTKCISVNSSSNLYLASKSFIPTHNTSMAAALECYFMGSGLFGNGHNPPIRVVHAFPDASHAAAYSKVKLNAMISGSLIVNKDEPKGSKPKSYMQSLIDRTSDSNDTLGFKQFIGGNHLWIESIGVDGNRLMGRTGDVILYDEVQKCYAAALGNSSKILSQARYGKPGEGIQVYFGTPLLQGSTYWDMWNASSQQYYHLGCEKCRKLFPLYTPKSNDWEETWIYGFTVRCPHCGFEQDKRDAAERGKWIPLKDQTDAKFVGFHINQLYIPTFTKEKIISEKPENNPINSEKTYQTQVLGEFYHGEATIITMDQVRDMCGDPERKFRANIAPDDDLLVFMGLDIGGKNDLEQLVDSERVKPQGQSYSTAVIIAMTGPQRMSIEFAKAFKRNDLASKKGIIDELMRRYSVNLAMCDLGYAHDLNEILQTEYGDKFLASQATNRVNEHIKFNSDIFPKVVVFEKDYWIADMYEQMKKGNVRLPLGSYEQIAMVIQHICSMEIKPSISRTGDITPHYVKGGSPNDFFMALLHAYLAYRFYVSEGFKIKHPLLMKDKKRVEPLAILGWIPRMR